MEHTFTGRIVERPTEGRSAISVLCRDLFGMKAKHKHAPGIRVENTHNSLLIPMDVYVAAGRPTVGAIVLATMAECAKTGSHRISQLSPARS